jgi:acyl-CoA reductase-like NAD-dependent aldehyde dehydrogenase
LGGKSANIVCEDCDLETAIDSAIAATYCNLGQSCNAGSRTFVHEKMYDAFCKRVVERVSALKVGDPFSKESEYGCIIDKL